jgi:hypothetical protein
MKRTLIVAALFAVSAAQAQTTIPIPTTQKLAWDHSAPASVTRFELNVDGGDFTDVGKTACAAPNAASFCAAVPALTQGAHSLVVRACNAAGCSAASAPPYAVIAVVIPAAPVNVRLVD